MSGDAPSPAHIRELVMEHVRWASEVHPDLLLLRESRSIAAVLGLPRRRVSSAISVLVDRGEVHYDNSDHRYRDVVVLGPHKWWEPA